jgi:hypothetical protein
MPIHPKYPCGKKHNYCKLCNPEHAKLLADSRIYTEEYRNNISEANKKAYAEGRRSVSNHTKRIEYSGIFFRSSWEVAFAK